MKTLSVLLFALVGLLTSCKEDDGTSFTSMEGDWTYTTPDSKISVDFTVVKNGSDFDVLTKAMSVDGTECRSEIMAANVEAKSIGSIRINANDSNVDYAYFILFTDLEVSADFKEIKVPGVTYTWPYNKTNQLTDVTITRK